MSILNKPANAEVGVISLTVHSAPGQSPVGDYYIQLVDKTTGETLDERRGGLTKLPLALRTALQTQPLPTALATIRSTLNTELAS